MLLSIVIPAYNEEKRIPQMLEQYLSFYRQQEVEFIVVLNGCRDNTSGLVQSFVAREKGRVRLMDIPEAIGKGGAVRRGFAVAGGDLVGFVDADGATAPAEFERLVAQLDGYDGAIASRWKTGSEVIGRNVFRKMVSLGFMVFVKLIFWMPFRDTQCGAKIFKRKLIRHLLPTLHVTDLAFDVELLYQATRAGYRLVEVPSRWVDQSSSALLGSPWGILKNSLRMLTTLLSIRMRK